MDPVVSTMIAKLSGAGAPPGVAYAVADIWKTGMPKILANHVLTSAVCVTIMVL
jgi:hypothetical protein